MVEVARRGRADSVMHPLGLNFVSQSSCQRDSLCYERILGEFEDLGRRDDVWGNICPKLI